MRLGGGKLARPAWLNAVAAGLLVHIEDQLTGRRFLVDTRASFSILPHQSSLPASGPKLEGPAGLPITCWGEAMDGLKYRYPVNLWYQRPYPSVCHVAQDVHASHVLKLQLQ